MRATGRVLAGAAGVAAVALLVVGLARLSDATLTAWGTVAAVGIVAAGWAARQRLSSEPTVAVRPAAGGVEDRPFAGFEAARGRVASALETEDGFERSLQPYLQELVTARLGDGARDRLGERGWQLVFGPPPRQPGVAELEDLVRRLQ
ncbi:hypothetical protein GHK86_07505 [Acidimicrobiaceae bacterium USS-CC1]|uniref:Uncharacterized protein n=1 Tax=Acidiferrimicrobium australe TaxID=2664430 RepID=A0ABW9QRV1_9ACTN|nr:hypothetical protein [Acidiferrimicrobium australe]